ncbi:YkvA family protein [Lewinella sp. JB7]|uniref:YkvA family protein n=1 Tax=Lewinella sp. JB7 TaxID=2962887 RepID=UPI0020C9C761|nr:YkvA family protein [Lewinella sp. JB7]MCP9235634.1 YkvA family protein [Lewinella sp. JB7]
MKYQSYRRYFSPLRFWTKIAGFARTAGTKTVYTALLLYYAYEREETPGWAKKIVLGALGYLVMPLDAVPDLTPILGYTDDVTVLGAGLMTIAAYINKDVRDRARTTLTRWLPDPREDDIRDVDARLANHTAPGPDR